MLIILEMFKLDRPYSNDRVEVAQREVNGNDFHSGICAWDKRRSVKVGI